MRELLDYIMGLSAAEVMCHVIIGLMCLKWLLTDWKGGSDG